VAQRYDQVTPQPILSSLFPIILRGRELLVVYTEKS